MLFIPDRKHRYKNEATAVFPVSERLHLPLSGFKCIFNAVVSKGEHVKQYQLLATKEGLSGGSIHAPVSGIIGETITIDKAPYLELFNDGLYEKVVLPPASPDSFSIQQFRELLHDYGIEGSGGARFPTAVKYNIEPGQIDTLIINGAECEPYLSADYALMKAYPDELARTIAFIQHLFKIPNAVIGIERQHRSLKPFLYKALRLNKVAGGVKLLPNAYPQGGELQLIRSVTGNELIKGTIPANKRILVNNVGTIFSIYKALFENVPYTHRMVTLYDEATGQGRNFWMPVGTPLATISAYFFAPAASASRIVLGGAMMGQEVSDERIPIHKGSGGVLKLGERSSQAENCIGCGYCIEVCPQKLLPLEFSRNLAANKPQLLKSFHLQDCIECGACAYVCPSRIPLMQDIRAGKKMIL